MAQENTLGTRIRKLIETSLDRHYEKIEDMVDKKMEKEFKNLRSSLHVKPSAKDKKEISNLKHEIAAFQDIFDEIKSGIERTPVDESQIQVIVNKEREAFQQQVDTKIAAEFSALRNTLKGKLTGPSQHKDITAVKTQCEKLKKKIDSQQNKNDRFVQDILSHIDDIKGGLANMRSKKMTEKKFHSLSRNLENQAIEIEFLHKQLKKLTRSKSTIASLIRKMDQLHQEVTSSEKKMKENNVDTLEERLMEEVVKLKADITGDHSSIRKLTEQLAAQVSVFKNHIKDVQSGPPLKESDVTDIKRDIEILRTRSQWLEDRMENFSIQTIIDKIEEFDRKVDDLKQSSPLVVE